MSTTTHEQQGAAAAASIANDDDDVSPLTPDSVSKLMAKKVNTPMTVQILSVQFRSDYRHLLEVSDGTLRYGMRLSNEFHDLVDSDQIQPNSIVTITSAIATLNGAKNPPVVTICKLDRDSLRPPPECGVIGNPEPFFSAADGRPNAPLARPVGNPGEPRTTPNGDTQQPPVQVLAGRGPGDESAGLVAIADLGPQHNGVPGTGFRAIVVKVAPINHYRNARGEGRVRNVLFRDATGSVRCSAFGEQADELGKLILDEIYVVRSVSKGGMNIKPPRNPQYNEGSIGYEITLNKGVRFDQVQRGAGGGEGGDDLADLTGPDLQTVDGIFALQADAEVNTRLAVLSIGTKFEVPKRDGGSFWKRFVSVADATGVTSLALKFEQAQMPDGWAARPPRLVIDLRRGVLHEWNGSRSVELTRASSVGQASRNGTDGVLSGLREGGLKGLAARSNEAIDDFVALEALRSAEQTMTGPGGQGGNDEQQHGIPRAPRAHASLSRVLVTGVHNVFTFAVCPRYPGITTRLIETSPDGAFDDGLVPNAGADYDLGFGAAGAEHMEEDDNGNDSSPSPAAVTEANNGPRAAGGDASIINPPEHPDGYHCRTCKRREGHDHPDWAFSVTLGIADHTAGITKVTCRGAPAERLLGDRTPREWRESLTDADRKRAIEEILGSEWDASVVAEAVPNRAGTGFNTFYAIFSVDKPVFPEPAAAAN